MHPRDNDLIVGTHGRSIWIMDDITPLQQLIRAVLAAEAHVFDVRPNVQWTSDTMMSRGVGGCKALPRRESARRNGDQLLPEVGAGRRHVKIVITDMAGRTVRELTGTKNAGINLVQWNFTAASAQGASGGAAAAVAAAAVAVAAASRSSRARIWQRSPSVTRISSNRS